MDIDKNKNSADYIPDSIGKSSGDAVASFKQDEFEDTKLYETTSNLSFNIDQLQQLLRVLSKYLRLNTNFVVEVSYSHGILGKLIGDLPYLNHLHLKSSKLKRMLIKLRGKEFRIDLSDVIKCEVVELDNPNEVLKINTVSISEWAASLLKEIESRAAQSSEIKDLLEKIILFNR